MEILRLWWVQALVISAGTALFLNGAPFLPYLNRIKARKMDARLVGFAGTTAAFYLWCKLNPELPARDAFSASLLIVALTVGVNWAVHLIRRDNPPLEDADRAGGVKVIEFRLTDRGEAFFERYLEDNSPDDPELAQLFELEQRRETVQERWENVLLPKRLLGLLDEAIVCVAQAVAEDNQNWLYTAVADLQEARETIRKAKHHIHLFYRLFCPEHAA